MSTMPSVGSGTYSPGPNMVCSPEQEKVGTGSIEAIICPVYSDLRIRATVSDFAKASVLFNAAAKSGCQAYLCLATYHRASYGEVDSYGYGRRGRYADYDEDVDESDFEEYDVSEEQVYAHAFVGADGTKIDVKKLDLDAED